MDEVKKYFFYFLYEIIKPSSICFVWLNSVFSRCNNFRAKKAYCYWNKSTIAQLYKPDLYEKFPPVWDKDMTPATVKDDFKDTGIYHFNPNAIAEEAFAPSSVSENAPLIKK